LTCFEQIIVHHQEVCTSSLQYFAMHLFKESSCWHDTIDSSINHIMSATRLLIKMHGKIL